jgi:hypothetical protein
MPREVVVAMKPAATAAVPTAAESLAADGAPAPVARSVRWVVLLLLLAIPARIIIQGYLPTDDALRHAAKAVSGKPWSELLVLGAPYTVDHNFGWEALLRQVHRIAGLDAERLVDLSVLGLFVGVVAAGLPWLRRPEAWLGTLLFFLVAWPPLAGRWMIGRPLLLTVAALMTVLFLAETRGREQPGRGLIAGLAGLVAAAVFVHGVWYLWLLPVLACLLARQAGWARGLAAAWLGGTLLAAVLTGHPVDYLAEAVRTALRATQMHPTARTMVSELQPSSSGLVLFLALGAVVVLRQLAPLATRSPARSPAFWVACLGWTLGFVSRRFWDDWGLPALLVFVAVELDAYLRTALPAASPRRLGVAACLGVALYCVATSDLESRWTRSLTRQYLVQEDPELAGWLPDRGGVFYAADPAFFYETFFRNPQAGWRYLLGFEMTLLPADDFQTLYRILWNQGAGASYQPWVEKLRPGDRLFVRGDAGSAPPIPGLEWHYTLGGMWSGRRQLSAQPAPR